MLIEYTFYFDFNSCEVIIIFIGHKIKRLRKELGYSQETLAERVQVSRQTISSWENDKSYPDINSLMFLSDIFNTSIDNLIREDVIIMKQELNNNSKEKIQRKKDLIVLNRLTAFRFISAILGGILLFPIYKYLELTYLIIPVLFLSITILLTLPIQKIRKKYQLKHYSDIVEFFDEKYS